MTSRNEKGQVETCWACDRPIVTSENIIDSEGDTIDVEIKVRYVKVANKKCPTQPGIAWVCPHCKAWNHDND